MVHVCKHATDNPCFTYNAPVNVNTCTSKIHNLMQCIQRALISFKVFIGMWNGESAVEGRGVKALHCGHRGVILVRMGDSSSIMHADR